MASTTLRTSLTITLAAALALAATPGCGAKKPANAPQKLGELATPLDAAFEEEATGDPIKAVDLYVKALAVAGASADNPGSVTIAMAALDALVHRDVTAFGEVFAQLGEELRGGCVIGRIKLVDGEDAHGRALVGSDGPENQW